MTTGRALVILCLIIFSVLICEPFGRTASAQQRIVGPIRLSVDASDARRKLFRAKMTIPTTPGPLTLVYPKWIPGEHEPSGPITSVINLKISANGQPIPWRRDEVDMYALHCQVPIGVNSIDVAFDYASPLTTSNGFVNGHNANATDKLAVLNWNTVVFYPAGAKPSDLIINASLNLPENWKYATALTAERETGGNIEFQPVTLETLVDSPVLSGAYFRSIDLTPGKTPDHILNLAADSPEALNIRPEILDSLRKLPAEATAVFGPGHYRRYNFLLALTDHMVLFGLEHHESSDNRINERALIDDQIPQEFADLLSHEFTHSWNGKYRRPAGLATSDYQQAMRSDMLWVYEGLTTYYGYVLSARIGLTSPEGFRGFMARNAAYLDNTPGRNWRPLEDTAIASQLLESAPAEWTWSQRSLDYYPEGALLWLEVDSIIRRESNGSRGLDDFSHLFYSGDQHAPSVKSYTFDDVIEALEQTAHSDWRAFFDAKVRRLTAHPPMGGIEADGWRLTYTDVPDPLSPPGFSYSLGIYLSDETTVGGVRMGSPADRAGLSAGMKLIAVNGRHFTTARLHEAVARTKSSAQTIELLVENGEYFRAIRIEYQGGERIPHLVRDESRPDIFEQLLKPRAASK